MTYTKAEIDGQILSFYQKESSTKRKEFDKHSDYMSRNPVEREYGSWYNALNEVGVPNDAECCPSCGDYYLELGHHWSKGECGYPEISNRQKEILTGLLMGDATLHRKEGGYPYFICSMISHDFLRWLDNVMGVMGRGVSLWKTAEESAKGNRESGFSPGAKEDDYNDLYRWETRSHPSFDSFASWYDSGEKRFSDNLELTPTILKVWYCCDGSMNKGRKKRRIQIGATNEVDRLGYIRNLFSKLDVEPTLTVTNGRYENQRLIINFRTSDSESLWEYMGEPLPGFGYKWPNEK